MNKEELKEYRLKMLSDAKQEYAIGKPKKEKLPDPGRIKKYRKVIEHFISTDMDSLTKSAHAIGFKSKDVVQSFARNKPFLELLDEYLPDDLLAERHNELLNKRDWNKVKKEDGSEELIDAGPNHQAVAKALEMAYKLKGAYKEKETDKKTRVIYNIINRPEVKNGIKLFEDTLKEQMYGNKKEIIALNSGDAGGQGGYDGGGEVDGGNNDSASKD